MILRKMETGNKFSSDDSQGCGSESWLVDTFLFSSGGVPYVSKWHPIFPIIIIFPKREALTFQQTALIKKRA